MNEDARNALEATAASAGMKATAGGVAGGFLGLISSSAFISLASLFIGIVGLIVTIYYKSRDEERKQEQRRWDQEEHDARMKRLQSASVRGLLDDPRQADGDES